MREPVHTPIPHCPATGDCFELVLDPANCVGVVRVGLDRKSLPDPATRIEVRCPSTATASAFTVLSAT